MFLDLIFIYQIGGFICSVNTWTFPKYISMPCPTTAMMRTMNTTLDTLIVDSKTFQLRSPMQVTDRQYLGYLQMSSHICLQNNVQGLGIMEN